MNEPEMTHAIAVELTSDTKTNLWMDPTGGAGYPRSVRSQADNLGDFYSELTRTENDGEQITRQEFAHDADINNIVAQYSNGGLAPAQFPNGIQIVDDSIDLTTALNAVDQARRIVDHVPTELKGKYRDWRSILNASETGEYQKDLADLAEQKKKAADEKAAKPAVTPAAKNEPTG